MAEEEAITSIIFHQDYLNAEELIREIKRCILHNEQIYLRLAIDHRSKFNDTLEMRNCILENIIHIKKFRISNFCRKRNEYLSWFHFVVEFLQQEANNNNKNGETAAKKHFEFRNFARVLDGRRLSLERTNQLVNAIHSNSNGNNIEKFSFIEYPESRKVFQPLWDALLESGVQHLHLSLQFLDNEDDDNTNNSNHNENDNTFNFMGLSTNTSLRRLDLDVRHMLQQDQLNIFHSIKVNKGLKKVNLSSKNNIFDDDREIAVFREMLSENSTLFDFKIYNGLRYLLRDEIDVHMKFNRMWNRYIMKRKEKATATTTAAANGTTIVPVIASTVDANNKKKFKMRLFLHLFIHKPVLRDTIIFHLLREYPGDLGLLNNNDDSQQQQNQMLLLLRTTTTTTTTVVSSCAAKNKKKRPYEE